MRELRIGYGYDVHRLTEGRALIIGGVNIPNDVGLLGHSDADVLIHAVMDAVIGALGEGDIGRHFPDTDEQYRGADSMNLLTHVRKMLEARGGRIINIDTVLVLQHPKVAPYIGKMRDNIAFCLGCEHSRVNVKATTEEKLGFTGKGEGASAHASVLIEIDV